MLEQKLPDNCLLKNTKDEAYINQLTGYKTYIEKVILKKLT